MLIKCPKISDLSTADFFQLNLPLIHGETGDIGLEMLAFDVLPEILHIPTATLIMGSQCVNKMS